MFRKDTTDVHAPSTVGGRSK